MTALNWKREYRDNGVEGWVLRSGDLVGSVWPADVGATVWQYALTVGGWGLAATLQEAKQFVEAAAIERELDR